MKNVLKKVTLISLNLLLLSAYANASNFSNMIVFGDSLSDVGNNTWIKAEDHVGAPVTNLSKTDSKRIMWVNHVVNKLFPGNVLYHSSQINSDNINPLKENINYAWSGAESGVHYINDDEHTLPYPKYNDEVCNVHGPGFIEPGNTCVPGIRRQVAQYLKDVNFHPNPNSVFIFWIGGNDIVNNLYKIVSTDRDIVGLFNSFSTTDENQPGYEDLSYPIINTMKAKNALIDAGVTKDHIYVLDVPDPSELPMALKIGKTRPEVVALLHEVSIVYNSNLTIAMTQMNPKYDLIPSHIFSTNALLTAIVSDPAKYDLQNVTDNCFDKNAEPFCEGFAFYNDKHPTTIVGKVLGDEMSKALYG